MQSYTFGSPAFIQAIISEGTKDKYPIEFNATDFVVFVKVLSSLSQYAAVNYKDFEEIPGYEDREMLIEPIEDWATQLLSSIGDSLGVEGI